MSSELIWLTQDEIRAKRAPSKLIIKNLISDVAPLAETIKGVIANKGKATGKAKIVLAPVLIKNFRVGEILVAPETTPDFVPFMKRAGAIITDIGGITSHAAIVSRELNKPCIIGTKVATQVLKDGDLVEVDASEGVVRIIKRV